MSDETVRLGVYDVIQADPEDEHLGELEITWSSPGENPDLQTAVIEDASVDV